MKNTPLCKRRIVGSYQSTPFDNGADSDYNYNGSNPHYIHVGDKMNNRDTMSRLNAALSKIDYAYALIAKKHGLSFNALMMVCLIKESESVTQKELCDALHLPKSTVHSILLDFITQDYVVLSPGNNKKEKFVRFTPAGAEAFRVILADMERFEDNILAALGDETCALLVKTAESLGEIVTKELGE